MSTSQQLLEQFTDIVETQNNERNLLKREILNEARNELEALGFSLVFNCEDPETTMMNVHPINIIVDYGAIINQPSEIHGLFIGLRDDRYQSQVIIINTGYGNFNYPDDLKFIKVAEPVNKVFEMLRRLDEDNGSFIYEIAMQVHNDLGKLGIALYPEDQLNPYLTTVYCPKWFLYEGNPIKCNYLMIDSRRNLLMIEKLDHPSTYYLYAPTQIKAIH